MKIFDIEFFLHLELYSFYVTVLIEVNLNWKLQDMSI